MMQKLKKLNIYIKLAIAVGLLQPFVIGAILFSLFGVYSLAGDNATSTQETDRILHDITIRVQILQVAGFVIGAACTVLLLVGLVKKSRADALKEKEVKKN